MGRSIGGRSRSRNRRVSRRTRWARNAWRTLVTAALFGVALGCARKAEPSDAEATSASAAPVSRPPATVTNGLPSAELARLCTSICENSRTLKCKNASECQSNCQGMGSLRPCLQQVAAFYRCLASEPADHWECAEDGVAAIKEGYCNAEQAGAVVCLEQHLEP